MGAKRAILGGLVATLLGVLTLVWHAGRPAAMPDVDPALDPVAGAPEASSAELVAPAGAEAPSPTSTPPDAASPPPARRLPGAARSIAVHAVDAAGQGLAGASVTIEWGSHLRAGRTDSTGRARITVPRDVSSWRARVAAEGFVETVESASADELQVQLDRAVSFHARVVDRDTGAAVPDARVRCPSPRSDAVEERTTGADGGFVLTVPEDRRIRVVVEAEGFLQEATWHSAADGAPTAALVLELTPLLPGAFSASVVDAVTGAPIEGARLRRITTGGRESFARSDAQGLVRAALASDWREEDLHLTVSATDYCGLVLRLRQEELASGLHLTLPLLPPTRLRGIVVDGDGAPCAGVKVLVSGRRGNALEPRVREQLELAGLDRAADAEGLQILAASGSAWARTAEDGTFEFANLVPWNEGMGLEARDGRRLSEHVELDALGGPGEAVWAELVLERTAAVHGAVTVRGEVPKEVSGEVRVHWTAGDDSGIAELDEDGAYAIEGLAAGPVELEPRIRWRRRDATRVYAPRVGERARVELRLRPGEDREVPLELEWTLTEVAGSVTTPAGEPRPGLPLYVRAAGQDDAEFAAMTDEEGRYGFRVEATGGPFDVSLRHGGRWELRAGVRPGDRTVDFQVGAGRAVRLRVSASDTGDELDVYYVSVRGAGEEAFRLVATSSGRDRDEDGYREFEVPADTDSVLVHYEPGGYRPESLDELAPGSSAAGSFDVELRPGTFVDLRLAPGTGPLPENSAVYLVEADLEFEPPSDPEGASLRGRIDGYADYVQRLRRVRFERGPAVRFEGLEPGRYRLVTGGDLRVYPEEFEVGPEGADVELSWSP